MTRLRVSYSDGSGTILKGWLEQPTMPTGLDNDATPNFALAQPVRRASEHAIGRSKAWLEACRVALPDAPQDWELDVLASYETEHYARVIVTEKLTEMFVKVPVDPADPDGACTYQEATPRKGSFQVKKTADV